MRRKSILTKSLWCLLFLLPIASFAPTAQGIYTDADANSTDADSAITATANLLKSSYTIGQPVPIEIVFTNHGQEPAYIKVDEFGFLRTNVIVEDANSSRIYPIYVYSPPPPPRYFWITIDGKKIYTEPVVKIEPGQTTKLAIQDALDLYHDQLQPGTYYLTPREQEVIHEVDSIITREDQEHKLWIQPSAVISRARYETNKVEITLYQEKIIYVDDDAVGFNDGSSWQNAYTFLQDALADANSAEKPVEIRVAQGIYKPDMGAGQTPGDREATFQLINDVNLAGGYAGLGQFDPNARDIELYQTILSGDLDGNDVDVNTPGDLLDEPTQAENCYHVVTGSNTNETAILDGFIITAGNANGSPTYSYGGGIFNYMGSPTLANCILRKNFATFGGGIACGEFSNPEITNCTINENLAARGGGGIGCNRNSSPIINNCLINSNTSMTKGGGIFLIDSNVIIIDCTISENRAWSYGGGIFCEYLEPIISNCLITGNVADIGGGGIDCLVSNPVITNCIISYNKSIRYHGGGIFCGRSSPSIMNSLITANESAVDGGGIHCSSNSYGQSSPTVTSCTIANNFAGRGGGGICCENSSTLKATNCIVWENIASHDLQLFGRNVSANLLLSNCNIQGSWPGEGNIDVDPLFADPIKGDYYLKSQAGRWNPDSGSWIFDYITSPCIDAGDPNIPVGDEPMPNGDRVNMGAYGGTPEASKTYIIATTIYVDEDAVGLNNGSSWQNAYTFLQDALFDAEIAEKPVEIRVAQGIYTPDENSISPEGTGDRKATFQLIKNVTIKGGYAGFSEPDPNARDINVYLTILSGDLNGDDVEVNDPCDLRNELNRYDNSSHVVTGSNTDATAVLDGFTVSAGHLILFPSMGSGNPSGGAGMYISSGSPTVVNCIFTGNATNGYGGGMINIAGSYPTIINCTFTRNYAGGGGGISNCQSSEGSNPKLIDCTFDGNYASGDGGGMYNYQSNPNLNNCTFSCNFSLLSGGGIYNRMSNLELTDCTFSENTAGGGGGMYSEDNSRLILTNCTFGNNVAERVLGGGMCNSDANDVFLTNCIFSGNSANRSGGGLGSNHNKLMLINCVFDENEAYGESLYTNKGGGLYVFGNTEIINCTFRNNWSKEGGGIYYFQGFLTVTGCAFTGNSAENCGGGMYNYDNMPDLTITNCTFGGNYAEWGGGIFNHWASQLRMANCTFIGNIASNGNALSSDPSFTTLPGRIELTNCILWNGENTLFDPNPDGSTIAITYSDVQGGWPGEGNIDADPCFVDPGYWADADDPNAVWIDGDYHLKSQAGRWDPLSESWIQDDVTSPCIDAGDPNIPVGDEPMPNGGIINIGIYGGTPEASKSYILSKIIYVDDDAAGDNDGTNWENAYTFLQDALADAESAIKLVEIRVAQGVYKPKLETGYRIPGTNITGSYLLRFQLINGVTLLGGYAGLTEPDPDTRDFEKCETILSGDLNGDDIDVINPRDLLHEPTRSDNCSSIVIGSGTNRTAVLDGFIITGGRVRVHPAVIDSPTGRAGGMKNESGSPTINNCTFTGNSAEGSGGGMLNDDGSSPIITNCKFIKNYGGRGGGVSNSNSNPTFINCTFTNNYADDGAGMSSSIWSIWEPTQAIGTKLIDCIFEDNNAERSGGGLIIYDDEVVLTNCIFIGNSASKGGGLYNNTGVLNLTNCQFIGNYAQEEGGGVAGSNSTLTDCIFIDNSSNRYGGGLAGNNSIYNCIMSGNTAVHNGGAIYGWGEVINCTVIGNKAGRNGGGICTQGITTLVNSIVHSNNALIGDEIYLGLRILPAGRGGTTERTPSVMAISYSNVWGGEEKIPIETDCTLAWESGNIDVDPLFTNPGYWDLNNTLDDPYDDIWVDGDYHLKSQAGRWDPASESWIQDDVTSLCIDAGDPNMPVGDEPMPNGGRINMGAYGGTPEASKSYTD